MAQPGNFTPILLYSSSTPTNVPLAANLTNNSIGAELAINIADKNLFFKDSGGTVNTVPIRQSSTSSNGWLSSTDWNTFNSKAPATSGTSILYGNGSGGFSNVTIGSGITFAGGTLSATGSGGTVTSVTGTSPVVSSGGTTPAISLATAYGDTLNPYASKTANYILAAPNGSAGVPTFRALVTADVTGLGTMATQNANSVAIIGGNIDGTTIGGTTPAVITGSTINANTKVVSPDFYAQSVLGGNLRTSGGTSLLNWDGGGSGNVTVNGGLLANPSNKNISLAPTGTGSVTVNPATTGAIDNMVIGATIPKAINGTTITATSFVGSGASLTNVVNSLTASTGISVSGSTGAVTVTNTAPDQTVALTSGTGISVTGTYPNFTVTNTAPSSGGTVTSVTATAPVASTGGTTPVISMPAATTSVSGYLTSTNWNTFNNKQPAGTYLTAVSIVSANGFAGTSSGGITPALTLSTSITGLLKGNGTAISAATSGTDYAPATSGSSILYGNGAGGFSNVTIGTGLTFVGGTLASTASGGTVTSVAATVPAFLSISGSPITTSGTLAITLSGTALPVANGGTGITSLTANYIPYGNGTSGFSSSSTLTYNGTILAATQIQSATIGSATGSTLSLQANATTYATLAASGEFLVGCTNLPASNRTLGWAAKTASSGGFQCYQVNSNSDWAINSSSGSICNFYSDTGSALTYAGSISVTSNITTYGSVSDYRLKENVTPISNALAVVEKLNPVDFTWKNTKLKGQSFIAHELQELFPDAVMGKKDALKNDGTPAYQNIDTSCLIATLVAAVKELKVEIDLLKAK